MSEREFLKKYNLEDNEELKEDLFKLVLDNRSEAREEIYEEIKGLLPSRYMKGNK